MRNSICRAFTFVNYHIPIKKNVSNQPQYSTIGYMDGLFTEAICIDYLNNNLKALWEYVLKKTEESRGVFSYQNIFGFGEETWNEWKDEVFWDKTTDMEFPLTFVVFLQTSNYLKGKEASCEQCGKFNRILKDNLQNRARWYTYQTIDKNDFIVCIKSQNYRETVDVIKMLHETGVSIVYSYSVLSVNQNVLDELSADKYAYLYEEKVDLVSLKGMINSFRGRDQVKLEVKGKEICNILKEKLSKDTENKCRIKEYDILGENDFEFIAENVGLGNVLEQFAKNGILNYADDEFRCYMYSSNMSINVVANSKQYVDTFDKSLLISEMDANLVSPKCDELEERVKILITAIHNDEECSIDDKLTTICQAVWQLLQSLKVLEYGLAKKYDFYSLYHPFELLISILEKQYASNEIREGREVYEFLQKISLTLHGTLRTDIQFFQVKDFNALVGYAPAKLRAFYSIWAIYLSNFYNMLGTGENKYSFIFSPGLYVRTSIVQLKIVNEKNVKDMDRLMLITVPERNLYCTKKMCIILAHEVPHFVGTEARNREMRHTIWRSISTRVLGLEIKKFIYKCIDKEYRKDIAEWLIRNSKFEQELDACLEKKEAEWRNDEKNIMKYHSENSIRRIQTNYSEWDDNERKMLIAGYLYKINKMLFSKKKRSPEEVAKWTVFFNQREEEWYILSKKYQTYLLKSVLNCLNYLCGEMFADIMSILTLGLSPEEYIMSFIDEVYPGYRDVDDQKNGLLVVRIGIVSEAIKCAISQDNPKDSNLKNDFIRLWKDGINRKNLKRMPKKSVEHILTAKVIGYIRGIETHKLNIEEYESILDERGNFTNKIFDWLNDVRVYEELSCYMILCAKTYMEKLANKVEFFSMREKLESTYRNIAGNSPILMLEEIEDFLCQYEENT